MSLQSGTFSLKGDNRHNRPAADTFLASALLTKAANNQTKRKEQDVPTVDINATEISLRFRNLSVEKVKARVELFLHLTALDLSHNRIDEFPRGLPYTVIALNLSHNLIKSLSTFKTYCSLIELQLRDNDISRLVHLEAILLTH